MRVDHAVELAAQSSDVEAGAGTCRRLHDGRQAERNRTVEQHHSCRGHARCRRPEGRVQSRERRWPDRRRCDREPSGYRHGVVHRIDASGHSCRCGRGRDGQACDARTRRKIAQHHSQRRRSRKSGPCGHAALLYQFRTVVPGADAHARAPFPTRRGGCDCKTNRGSRHDRRSAQSRNDDGTRRQRSTVDENSGTHRARHRGRRDARDGRSRPARRTRSRFSTSNRPCSPTSPAIWRSRAKRFSDRSCR